MANYEVLFHKVTGKRASILPSGAKWGPGDREHFDIVTVPMTAAQLNDVKAERADPAPDGKVLYRVVKDWGETKLRDSFLNEAAVEQAAGEPTKAQMLAAAANHVSLALDAAKTRLGVVEVYHG